MDFSKNAKDFKLAEVIRDMQDGKTTNVLEQTAPKPLLTKYKLIKLNLIRTNSLIFFSMKTENFSGNYARF